MWPPATSASPSGRLIGRAEIAEQVLRVLHAAAEGPPGQAVLVQGRGGVGKSTFLRASEAAARSVGFRVLAARALASDVPPPFALITELLRAARTDPDRPAHRRSAHDPLPLFAAAVDVGPGEVSPEGDAPTEPAEAGPVDRLLEHLALPAARIDADRSGLFGRISDLILERARDRPLALFVDDLQFADASSLEFLRGFLPSLAEGRVAIVATCSPFAELPPRTAPAIRALAAGPEVTSVELRAMSESELAEFVRTIGGGADPAADTVVRLYSQTEGNPLFTELLVRAASGSLPTDVEGRTDLDALLTAQAAALPEADRRVVAYAAVLGREFRFATLARASGLEEERLSETLDRLVHGGLLREHRGEVYEFVSERVRTDLYAQLTETRRRLLHGKVARALREEPGGSDATFELARQFYLGRDDPAGVEYNRRAADLAVRAYAFDTAAVYLERALECQRRIQPHDTATEVRLLIELGRLRDELGDLHRSEEVLLDAVARARSDAALEAELALALLGLAATRGDLSQYLSARDLASEAFRILERLGHRRGLITAHRVLGVACWRLGELETAEAHQRAEVALAATDGSPADHGHAMIDLANTLILYGTNRSDEALRLYEDAARIFASTQDHSARARVLMNRALLHHFAGRSAPALADMSEALAAAERSRSRIWIGYCNLNLAQFHAEGGATDRAREEVERASQLLDPLGDQLAHQQVTMIRGMIAEVEGRYDEAAETFAAALREATELSLQPETAEMHYRLAALASRRGDAAAARRELAEARRAGIDKVHVDLLPRVEELERRFATS